MNVVLNNKLCCVEFDQYEDNDNVAIQLVRKRKGRSETELVATATVNTDMKINNEFVAIKGWSENTGIEQALIQAEVICPDAVGVIPCGMAAAYVYELTPKAKEMKSKS